MESLAAMVLNGDGQYLIGSKSKQPEIQAFIDNVPAYMVMRAPCLKTKLEKKNKVANQVDFLFSHPHRTKSVVFT